jgi:hypothetical protein
MEISGVLTRREGVAGGRGDSCLPALRYLDSNGLETACLCGMRGCLPSMLRGIPPPPLPELG